ncbi:MAG: metallo-mystery pair system four-Cys motif protein [Burkholderiaceae bacterium]|nr:metallo-mystery pair system four-Cys motif protein [Burkholderiaceae bacterium]
MSKIFLNAVFTIAAAAALTACGGGGSDSPVPEATQNVALEFAAVAGTAPVQCGTVVQGLGIGGVAAQVKDLRFYISDVALLKADGSPVPLALSANDDWNLSAGADRTTLIDLENATGACSGGTPATNALVRGTVPAGNYVGVKMTMGVPFALNHTLYSDVTTAKPPLDIAAMAWSWQAGRKFSKIELTDPAGADGTWTAKTFAVHLGSTGCTGNPATGETVKCLNSNRMQFQLNNFHPAQQKIAIDLKALLEGNDITRNVAGAAGCMSGGTDPECAGIFKALAIDWKADGTGTGLPINGGAAQTVFRTIAR